MTCPSADCLVRNNRRFGVFVLLSAALGTLAFAGGYHSQRQKKEQVLPLPAQPPMALRAETGNLDFHLSPLLKKGGLALQIRQSLAELIRDTHGETIIKLRAFVAGAGDARRVQAEVTQVFGEHKLPLPGSHGPASRGAR